MENRFETNYCPALQNVYFPYVPRNVNFVQLFAILGVWGGGGGQRVGRFAPPPRLNRQLDPAVCTRM